LARVLGFQVEKTRSAEEAARIVSNYDAGAIITSEPVSDSMFRKPVTILMPKTIIVGLGARKDATETAMIEAVKFALTKVNVPLERVGGLATVSIKKDSENMTNAARALGLTLDFLDVEKLRAFKHEDLSPDSEIVQRRIGVGGVCERAALIKAGKNAKLIQKKMKLNGVTVAVAEGE